MRSNVPRLYRLPHHGAEDWPDTILIPARRIDAALGRIIRSEGCHLYNGGLRGRSVQYPMLTWQVQGQRYAVQVSRLVLMLTLDRPIRPGMYALHSCNNPFCCRGEHIREGSHADNRADRSQYEADVRAGRIIPLRPSRIVPVIAGHTAKAA